MIVLSLPVAAVTYPQLALGGGYQCVVLVSNKTPFEWAGKFYLYQGQKARWSGTWAVNGKSYTGSDGFNIIVPGYGTSKIIITGDDTARSGYMEMSASGSSSTYDVVLSYFYQHFSNGKMDTSTGSPDADSYKTFYFPVEFSATTNTGFAWAPWLSYTNFEIIATLYVSADSGNVTIYTKKITFDGHKGQFINQLFPELNSADFRGYLKLESQNYFYLEVLRMDTTENGILFTSIPPGT
jgi:hypothetical protein